MIHFKGYFLGDYHGEPVGDTEYFLDVFDHWKNKEGIIGGPYHFRFNSPGCGLKDTDEKLRLRDFCFDSNFVRNNLKQGCNSTNTWLFQRDNYTVTYARIMPFWHVVEY